MNIKVFCPGKIFFLGGFINLVAMKRLYVSVDLSRICRF